MSSNRRKGTSTHPPRPRNRQKTSTSASSGSTRLKRPSGVAALKMLPEMPLDIIFEIFSYLAPDDVLWLSRTSKDLRAVLTSKSARSIWKFALEIYYKDDTLPVLPGGLNELQLVNLIVDDHCNECFKAGATIFWTFQVRLCANCGDERFPSTTAALTQVGWDGTNLPAGMRPPEFFVQWPPNAWLPTNHVDSNEVRETYETVQQLSSLSDTKPRDEYLARRKAEVEEAHSIVVQCMHFQMKRQARLNLEMMEIRRVRRDSLIDHLCTVGYGDEVNYLKERDDQYLMDNAFVKCRKDLSDAGVSRMLNPLLAELEASRERIRERIIANLYKTRQRCLRIATHNYARTRPSTEILPSLADFCFIEEIQDRLLNKNWQTDRSEDAWTDLIPKLPELCRSWQRAQDEKLSRMLPAPSASQEVIDIDDTDDEGDFQAPSQLELATTFFKCTHCHEPLGYPRVLAHECTRTLRHGISNQDTEPHIKLLINLHSEPWNWTGDRIGGFHTPANHAMCRMLDIADLDPHFTTVEDLDEDTDLWFECLRKSCNKRGCSRVAFRWRNALMHELDHHSRTTAKWDRLDEEDTDDALKLEALAQGLHDPRLDFFCVHCRDRRDTLFGIRTHLQYEHSLGYATIPVLGTDFVRHPDASMDAASGLVELSSPIRRPKVVNLADDDQVG